MGLSQVNVYTAGGSGSDISIPGLTEQEAERISAFIIGKTRLQVDEEE
jgi:membrane protein YdbS with pleckstrin-like domain